MTTTTNTTDEGESAVNPDNITTKEKPHRSVYPERHCHDHAGVD